MSNTTLHHCPTFILAILLSFLQSTVSAQHQASDEEFCAFDYNDEPISNELPPVPIDWERSHQGDYVIPVAVHVFYAEENDIDDISDTQIHSAIDQLNAHFAGEPGGTDSFVRFELAKVDPDGNCTTGIDRIQHPTPVASQNGVTNDCAINHSDMVDMASWQQSDPLTANYLDIYVVSFIVRDSEDQCESSALAGFSTGPPSTKGVFISGARFGTVGSAQVLATLYPQTDPTHEVGHFLRLSHLWGGDTEFFDCLNSCETAEGAACNVNGDGVCDTAPCNTVIPGTLANCDIPFLSCTNCDPFDHTDYIYPADNFMSYNRSCNIRFTPGQIQRMQHALETAPSRIGLWSEENLQSTGVGGTPISPIGIQSTSISAASCDDIVGQGGEIDITVSGGTPPYIFSWSNESNGQDLEDVGSGTYFLTVTDDDGNCLTEGFDVGGPSISGTVIPTCPDSEDGSIDITVQGMPGTLTYAWNDDNSTTTQDLDMAPHSQLSEPYEVTVTSSSGCVIQQPFIVPRLSVPNIEEIHLAYDDCYEPTAASISIEWADVPAVDYADVYTYTWYDEGEELSNVSDLPFGTYTVVVENPYSGCSSTFETTVGEGYPISDPELLVIEDGETVVLTADHHFLEGIEVMDGGLLTIDGASLGFAYSAGIDVHPGGAVTIENNSLLTSFDCEVS